MSDVQEAAPAPAEAPKPNPSGGDTAGLNLQGWLDARKAERGEAPAPAPEPEVETEAEPEAEAAPEAEPDKPVDVLELLLDDHAKLTPEQLVEATTIARKMRREQRKQARRIERREAELADREKTLTENLELLQKDASEFMRRHNFDVRAWALSEVERETATPEQKKIAELEAKLRQLDEKQKPPDPDAARASDVAVLAAHFDEHVDEYEALSSYDAASVAEAACTVLYAYHEKTGRVLTADQALQHVARQAALESELDNDDDAQTRKPVAAKPGGADKKPPPPTATNRAASERASASSEALSPDERRRAARRLVAEAFGS